MMSRRTCRALWLVVAFVACAPAQRQELSLAVDELGGADAAISPDGKRVLTSSLRSGNWELWMYEIDVGRWTQLTFDPAEDIEGKFSPDGHHVVFTSTRSGNKDLYRLDLADGRLTRLTDDPEDDEYPAWSADGRSIVFTGGAWKQRDFFVVAVDGTGRRRVSRKSGWAGACAFEQSGISIVCHRYDNGTGDIVRIRLADGHEQLLTSDAAWDYKPTVAPDGSIAFSRSTEGSSAIWLIGHDGSAPRPITTTTQEDRWPMWTGNGKDLFFHRLIDRGVGLYRLDLATGERVKLVGDIESPRQADLDRSGTRLAYCADVADRWVVRIKDLTTGATSQPLEAFANSCYPRWSPSGSQLAFVARRSPTARWEIGILDLPSGESRLLTEQLPNLRGLDGPLDWAIDGRQVVFQADTLPFAARLFTIDTGTQTLRAITPDGDFDEAPRVTPDGRHVVFMSTRGGGWTWSLYQASLDDGSLVPLTAPDYVEKNYPIRVTDGNLYYACADGRGRQVLVRQRPNGAREILNAAGDGVRWPTITRDGRYALYTLIEHRVEFRLTKHAVQPPLPFIDTQRVALVGGASAVPVESVDLAQPRSVATRRLSPVDHEHR